MRASHPNHTDAKEWASIRLVAQLHLLGQTRGFGKGPDLGWLCADPLYQRVQEGNPPLAEASSLPVNPDLIREC
jgi:hypothetical protein